VAPCTDDFDALVSCDNLFKNFLEDASYRSRVSYNVSSESTHRVCCRFLFKINLLFEMCVAFYALLVSKELKYQKKCSKFSTLFVQFLPFVVFHCENPLYYTVMRAHTAE
jgi:hypothetical protein